MQKRKLQVFVSSTYLDLKEERQVAVTKIINFLTDPTTGLLQWIEKN